MSHISFKFNNVRKENSNGTLKKMFSQLMLRHFRTTLHESLIHGQNLLFLFSHVRLYFYFGISDPVTLELV